MPRSKKITEPRETDIASPVKAETKTSVQEEKVSSEENQSVKKVSFYTAAGRRKTATAWAKLYLPEKEITINNQKLSRGDVYVNGNPIDKYFNDAFAKASYTEVFRTTNTAGRFITVIRTEGSGKSGQLGAVILAISRALVKVDPKFRAILRKKNFLTRDPRAKERKKPGLMGARKQKSSPKR